MTWHGFSWPGSILWMPLRPSGLWSSDAVILTERSLFDVVSDRSEVGPHCFYFMIYRYLLFVPIFDLSLRAVYRWTACLETLGCYDMLTDLIWLILSSFPLVSTGGMYILTVFPPWQLQAFVSLLGIVFIQDGCYLCIVCIDFYVLPVNYFIYMLSVVSRSHRFLNGMVRQDYTTASRLSSIIERIKSQRIIRQRISKRMLFIANSLSLLRRVIHSASVYYCRRSQCTYLTGRLSLLQIHCYVFSTISILLHFVWNRGYMIS